MGGAKAGAAKSAQPKPEQPQPPPSEQPPVQPPPVQASTVVTLSGRTFLINGAVTHPGTPLEGTLPNSRMVQATFDDANAATVANWNYPGGAWDPSRNTEEFVQALPSYRARGLLAVTLNFQGGGPKPGLFTAEQSWDNSGFDAAGNLKPPYLARMDRAIKALGRERHGRDRRLFRQRPGPSPVFRRRH